MIFSYYCYNPITEQQMHEIIDPVFSYVHQEHIPFTSIRDWEYAIPIHLANIKQSDVILDVGCATSYFFIYLSRMVKLSFGIDDINYGGFSGWTIDWFNSLNSYKEYIDGGAIFLNMNAKELPFKDNYFDKIFTYSAFEHFLKNEDTECAKEIYRCLKPGGLFIGSVDLSFTSEYPLTDNPDSRFYTYESFIKRILIPSKLQLVGEDYVKSRGTPIIEDKQFITSLLFCLRKV